MYAFCAAVVCVCQCGRQPIERRWGSLWGPSGSCSARRATRPESERHHHHRNLYHHNHHHYHHSYHLLLFVWYVLVDAFYKTNQITLIINLLLFTKEKSVRQYEVCFLSR